MTYRKKVIEALQLILAACIPIPSVSIIAILETILFPIYFIISLILNKDITYISLKWCLKH